MARKPNLDALNEEELSYVLEDAVEGIEKLVTEEQKKTPFKNEHEVYRRIAEYCLQRMSLVLDNERHLLKLRSSKR